MRKGLSICGVLLFASVSLIAQGNRPSTGSVPGSPHSNAPSGPSAGEDQDTGRARATDVGKGKKEGLETANKGKAKSYKKHHKEQLKS